MPDRKTQLYFHPDISFEFIKREMFHSCLVIKKDNKLLMAWPHSYKGEKAFYGSKNIPADMVTLGFARDIFLDPHEMIPEIDDSKIITSSSTSAGKPKRDKIAEWIAKVGTKMRNIYHAAPQTRTLSDYINMALIAVIFIMVIAWGIRFAAG